MSSYSELIKNFEKIRTYMREFYIYGFKSRSEYDKKSARSYDDERRRVESWLGDYMGFVRTPEGKNIFISIDSRTCTHNPFYKAWKAKSFTDGDITLHFILFDILNAPDIVLSLSEILQKIDTYLCCFDRPMMFDESTVRKKLKEYMNEGIIAGEKRGRSMVYRRSADIPFAPDTDALHFYSEIAPCGVIGSYLSDKYCNRDLSRQGKCGEIFSFKHHYITSALDSDVVSSLFDAMSGKCAVTAVNISRRSSNRRIVRLIPLRIFISVRSGRQHLLAYQPCSDAIKTFRIDYLSDIKKGPVYPRFDELRAMLDYFQKFMWGVNITVSNITVSNITGMKSENRLEHLEFTVEVNPSEDYIARRLEREKRIGTVEKPDDTHYRFYADVYDSRELIPWIRTFICRITAFNCSEKSVENLFKKDIEAMYAMYRIDEPDGGGLI